MTLVVRGLEEHVGIRRNCEFLLLRIDANRECALRVPVRADPGEQLPADLERGLPVGRRLLGARERAGELANRRPVGHQSAAAM